LTTLLQWLLFVVVAGISIAAGIAMGRVRSRGLRHGLWPRPRSAYPPGHIKEELWRVFESLPRLPCGDSVERLYTKDGTEFCLVVLMLDAPSSYADLHRYGDALAQAGWEPLGFRFGRRRFAKGVWRVTVMAGPVAVGAEVRVWKERS
jgi:hypothetical protein